MVMMYGLLLTIASAFLLGTVSFLIVIMFVYWCFPKEAPYDDEPYGDTTNYDA